MHNVYHKTFLGVQPTDEFVMELSSPAGTESSPSLSKSISPSKSSSPTLHDDHITEVRVVKSIVYTYVL